MSVPLPPAQAAVTAAVVVASNRAADGVYEDETGPLIVDALRSWGFEVGDAVVVHDGDPVGRAIAGALAGGVAAVVTTGGTGINPTDRTPEATRPLLDRELPGVAEAMRAKGVAAGVPTAVLSRGLAGVAGDAVVVNLPGSRGGVKDGLAVLADILPHAVDQLRGGDHVRSAP
jgi:molybdenum cofactor synthesis domain-containing protein